MIYRLSLKVLGFWRVTIRASGWRLVGSINVCGGLTDSGPNRTFGVVDLEASLASAAVFVAAASFVDPFPLVFMFSKSAR